MSFPHSAESSRHRVFDQVIASNIELPELESVPGLEHSISFYTCPELKTDERNWTKIHDWRLPNGRVTISSAQCGGDYFLKFPRLANFQISMVDQRITCFAKAELPSYTIRHLLLDQVIPRVLGHQGRLLLHSGAVILPKGDAVAFLGDTGWGKSTITSSFHQHGAQLLTDDCLLTESFDGAVTGIPAYPGLRLSMDSIEAIFGTGLSSQEMAHYSEKKRLGTNQFCKTFSSGPIALGALFVLADPASSPGDNRITIEPLHGVEAVMAIIRHSFSLDLKDRHSTQKRMEMASKLISSGLAVYHMQYSRKYSILPILHQKIRQVMRGEIH